MKNKTKLAESLLRRFIRQEIQRIREAEGAEEVEDQEAEKQPEEKPTPEQEPEQEEGLDPKLQAINSNYIRQLKDSDAGVGAEELIEMLSDVIETFAQSSDTKLMVLKSIKNKIVR